MRLVECVPNFSEGRDLNILNKIAEAIKSVDGVTLLDMDPGADTNRTVFTFVGEPESVGEAAFLAIKTAAELIDMRKHKGAHPRQGATDVCPFIPVSGVSEQECIELSKKVAQRVGEELKIPVYLYEKSAQRPERQNLADIRAGEYEALPEKLGKEEWKPDFGPNEWNDWVAKTGATVIGVRDFLIAYNINLNTKDVKKCKKIANRIREKGTFKRDTNGKIVRDENGKKVREPGIFKFCKATAWYIEEYGQAQITMNLTNYKVTPPHLVFDKVDEMAREVGLRVTGSELVGLIPKEAMLMAGRYYLKKQGKSTGVSEKELIHIAVKSLGLDDISPFNPEEKIIEYAVSKRDLPELKVVDFIEELGSDSPAPGGGSTGALMGALSCALSSMVTLLTYDKKGYKEFNDKMEEIGISSNTLRYQFIDLIDKDTDAFNRIMKAMKLPKKTEEDKAKRNKAIEEATIYAAEVPLETLRRTRTQIDNSLGVIKQGNQNSLSDSAVSLICAYGGALAAYYNVLINLKDLKDKPAAKGLLEEAGKLMEEVAQLFSEGKKEVEEKLQ